MLDLHVRGIKNPRHDRTNKPNFQCFVNLKTGEEKLKDEIA
jgi:hypothetical protein